MRKLRKIRIKVIDLLGKRVDKDLVILRSDGGICSQIAFWALGQELESLGHNLKYDLTWFRECGTDMNGDHVRNYDLDKAFPKLRCIVASDLEVARYKRKFRTKEMEVRKISAPAYLGEYYDRWPLVLKHAEILKQNFCPDDLRFDHYNSNVLDDISSAESPCAVHVRRGDLGVFNQYYGEPLSPKYFLDAMRNVSRIHLNSKFFLFSDEPEWIKEYLIPQVEGVFDYKIVDGNGADKGYLDLYLMSKCQSFIASHGSLAKYARVLSSGSGTIVEPRSKSDFNTATDENVIII